MTTGSRSKMVSSAASLIATRGVNATPWTARPAPRTSLIDVVRETFAAWIDLLASQLETTGLEAERA